MPAKSTATWRVPRSDRVSEDRAILVEDYPLLPVRRRFWEHVLRAVDGRHGQPASHATPDRV